MNLITRVVPHLVRSARRNPNPVAGSQRRWAAIHFHDGFTCKYVKKLLSIMVEVTDLRRARRYALLNYAELRILYQVPAITPVAPDVMLGS